jgi:hypothetical protein
MPERDRGAEPLPPEQRAKLPVWAQQHIGALERYAIKLEGALRPLTENPPTRLRAGHEMIAGVRYLNESDPVRFDFGQGNGYVEASFEWEQIRREDGGVRRGEIAGVTIMWQSHGMSGRRFAIVPASGNTIRIALIERAVAGQ